MAWPSIDPGSMIHRITILQQTPGSDSSGTTVNWTPFVVAWAAINPVRANDIVRHGLDTAQLYVSIEIRWQAGILTNMRVQTESGAIYIIQAIENQQERNVILRLVCIAVGPNE